MKKKEFSFYSLRHDTIIIISHDLLAPVLSMMVRHEFNFNTEYMYLGKV